MEPRAEGSQQRLVGFHQLDDFFLKVWRPGHRAGTATLFPVVTAVFVAFRALHTATLPAYSSPHNPERLFRVGGILPA